MTLNHMDMLEIGIAKLWRKSVDNLVIWQTVFSVVVVAEVTEVAAGQGYREGEGDTHPIEIQVLYNDWLKNLFCFFFFSECWDFLSYIFVH